jgi:hypothetical protein
LFAGNGLKGEGTKILSQGLKENKALKSLNLYGNLITTEGVQALAEVIAASTPLEHLNLDGEKQPFAAQMLISFSLCLSVNAIKDDGAVFLAEALKVSKSLRGLLLGCKKTTTFFPLSGFSDLVLFSHWTVSRRANYHCRKSQSEHVLAPP